MFGGRLRPQQIFILLFLRRLICRPKRCQNAPPTRSAAVARSSLPLPTATSDYQLIATLLGQTAATYDHGQIPLSLNFVGLIAAPNDSKTTPRHVPTRSHALLDNQRIANAEYRLVVAFSNEMTAIEGQDPPSRSLFRWVAF